MNIPKAIELLSNPVLQHRVLPDPETLKAILLGIQALKHLERCRENHCDTSFADLPGETTD